MRANIIAYLNKLEAFKTSIKSLHWAAKTMTEHELMDKLADTVADHQDEVAEIAQGALNVKIGLGELKPRAYTTKSARKTIDDIYKAAEKFYATIQRNKQYVGLRSEVENFLGQINKYGYLVDMCIQVRQSTKKALTESIQKIIKK